MSQPTSRPLSPHLQVYRWPATMLTSITHRATGLALAAGTLLLAWWLMATATGPESYETFRSVVASWPGLVVLFGFTWALVFHLLNGLRHLYWDIGRGFDNAGAERSSRIVLILSIVATVSIWLAA